MQKVPSLKGILYAGNDQTWSSLQSHDLLSDYCLSWEAQGNKNTSLYASGASEILF